jgi:hypothetical protein
MTLDGNDAALSRLGLLRFVREAPVPPPNGGSTPDGRPTFILGEGKLPGVLVSGRTFAGDDTWEVLASTQRSIASQPSVIALWLDDGCRVSVGERGEVLVSPDSTSSLVVLDGAGVRFVGVLAFENFRGPAHIEGATLHVLGRGMTFEMGTRPIRVRRRD